MDGLSTDLAPVSTFADAGFSKELLRVTAEFQHAIADSSAIVADHHEWTRHGGDRGDGVGEDARVWDAGADADSTLNRRASRGIRSVWCSHRRENWRSKRPRYLTTPARRQG